MNIDKYKEKYPNNVLVCIERYNKSNGTVLFDFVDSNEYSLFSENSGLSYKLGNSSMVYLKNYNLKNVRENTTYSINIEILQSWKDNNRITINNENSFVIGYIVNLEGVLDEIFSESVSINGFSPLRLSSLAYGGWRQKDFNVKLESNSLQVVVRNVGQGNWNEIKSNNQTKLVYDAGTSMYASRNVVLNVIQRTNNDYSITKPVLILSHWDVDHYHCLIGMTDSELNNFSKFICRNKLPNLTSRLLYNRLATAIGTNNILALEPELRFKRGGLTHLLPIGIISPCQKLIILNAQEHSNRNISGIVICIRNEKTSVVLSGDCHYEQISKCVLQYLTHTHQHHFVVPHHCGNAGNYQYDLPDKVKSGKAIISVGNNNYGHPMKKYIDELEFDNFEVVQTKVLKQDIIIDL